MTSSTSTPIGFGEPWPEPCDGSDEDATSNPSSGNAGAQGGSQTFSDAEMPDYAAFGAWILNQCPVDPEAQRLVIKWQHSMQPASLWRRRLTPAMLERIASRAAHMRLSLRRATPASQVDELCLLNKRFHRMVLRKLEACDTAYVGWVYTFLSDASRDESEFLLRLYVESFCAILEHSQLVFPNVELSEDASEVDKLQLAGVERLELPEFFVESATVEDVARIIGNNKDSLKALKMPMSLFSLLPPGLKLEEFVTCTYPKKLEVPWTLDTKVFKREHRTFGSEKCRIPPEFVRTVNADEIRIEVFRIEPNSPDPPAAEPSNARAKKLVVDIVNCKMNKFEFVDEFCLGRIVRDVAVMCPALECFELVWQFDGSWPTSLKYIDVVHQNTTLENAVKNCSAPFTVCLKKIFHCIAKSEAEVSDFARLRCGVELPPICRVHDGREHYHLVREAVFGKNSVIMNFKIDVYSRSE